MNACQVLWPLMETDVATYIQLMSCWRKQLNPKLTHGDAEMIDISSDILTHQWWHLNEDWGFHVIHIYAITWKTCPAVNVKVISKGSLLFIYWLGHCHHSPPMSLRVIKGHSSYETVLTGSVHYPRQESMMISSELANHGGFKASDLSWQVFVEIGVMLITSDSHNIINEKR